MATFLTRLQAAMRKTGALASGDTPTSAEQTDGLAIANQMLDAWSSERLMIFDEVRTTHTLTAAHNPHTIGASGGDFTSDRPVKIEGAGIIPSGQTTESPIYVAHSIDEYQAIGDKTSQGVPTFLWYEAAYPLGKLFLTLVPSAAHTLVLYRWSPLSSIASVSTAVAFPPGYEEAFDANLAIRLAADGLGVASQDLYKLAAESLARIKSNNVTVPILSNDAAGIGGNRGGGYNILTGGFR